MKETQGLKKYKGGRGQRSGLLFSPGKNMVSSFLESLELRKREKGKKKRKEKKIASQGRKEKLQKN